MHTHYIRQIVYLDKFIEVEVERVVEIFKEVPTIVEVTL